MLKLDDKDIKQFERELLAFKHRAFPFATKNTLDGSAFRGQKLARIDARIKMIMRNRFTVSSIQVHKVKGLNPRTQESAAGSTVQYMEDQEFGTTNVKRGKRGEPIPTGFSAGQKGQIPRTRLVTSRNRLKNIRLQRNRTGKTRKQRNLRTIQRAIETNNRFVFMKFAQTQGIFKVVGGRKGFKRGMPNGARLEMVHDLTRQSVIIPPNSWLRGAFEQAVNEMPELYKKSLIFQLKRHGLFEKL